jgi:hypothetical protein
LRPQGLTSGAPLFVALYGSAAPVKVVHVERVRFAQGFFCGSTLTVLADPKMRLVRKARRDFQPEFPKDKFNKLTTRLHQANGMD